MKGKKLLSLISILASAAVVGTTFAIYAVSDEADPFGVKITPGSLNTDGTPLVTLKYGSAPQKANIGDLEAGKPRLAAIVDLLADTSDDTAYTGKFTVQLLDQTGERVGTPAKLIDKLEVKVYDAEVAAAAVGGNVTTDLSKLTPIGSILTSAESKEAAITVKVTDNQAKRVYVVVSLAESSASEMSDFANDVVYLQIDWGKGSNQDVEATPIYLQRALEAGQKAYIYAWKSADNSQNADYPGVEMTNEGNGLHSYLLSTSFDKVKFSIRSGDDEVAASEDQTITSAIRQGSPSFNMASGSWGAKPDPSLNAAYYVKGTMNNWTANSAWALTIDAEDSNHYSISGANLTAETKLKVWGKDLDNWFNNDHPYDNCGFSIDEDGNVVVSEAGVYTINLYVNSDDGNHITLVKAAA